MPQMLAGSAEAPATYTILSSGDGGKSCVRLGDGSWPATSAHSTTTPIESIELDTDTQVTDNRSATAASPPAHSILNGTCEAGATIQVTCAPASVGNVTYPTTDTWQVAIDGIPEGSHDVAIISTDAAGNQDSADITARRSIPTTATIQKSGENLVANNNSTLQLIITVKDSLNQTVCDDTSIDVTTDVGVIIPASNQTQGGQVICQLKSTCEIGTATVDGQVW